MQTDAIVQSYFNFKAIAEKSGAMLLPVTKTHPVERIKMLYDAGCRDFAENKVQEIMAKKELLPADVRWHLIGHLQSNKVKYIAPFIAMIHSVDSKKLLLEIDKQGAKAARIIHCLLQVHVAREDTKFGFSPEEMKEFVSKAINHDLKYVRVDGIMAMASFTEDTQQIASEFAQVQSLYHWLGTQNLPKYFELQHLSMGMSSDYPIALQHGSTIIRIGSAILGAR